jgi:putative peptidoglycan lipid II flippase
LNRGAIARAALLVTAFTLISRVLGFLREAYLAKEFGTSAATDAFATALMLVNSVAAILAYTMVSVIIPAIERERHDHDERSSWRLVWTVGAWVTIGLVGLGAVVGLWPDLVVAPFGFDEARAQLLRELVQIMAPALALQGITGLLTAVLQAQRKFLGPAVVGIAFNLGIIVALALFGGIRAAAWGVVIGAAAQVLFQLPQLIGAMREVGVWRPQLTHPRLGVVLASAGPIALASVLQQINAFSDKYFAAPLGDGHVSALNFAHAAGSLPRTAFLMPLLAPLFPVIARMAAERRHTDTAGAFHRAAGVLALVSLPLGAFMVLYANEVAQLMFGRGRCDISCVTDIAGPLRFLAIATWASFLGYLLNRTINAMNASRDIFLSTAISVVVVIGLDIVLVGPMGISGLALASSLGVFTSLVISLVQLKRILPQAGLRPLAIQQARMLLAIALACVAAWASNGYAPTLDRPWREMALPLAVKTLIGGMVFISAMRILAPAVLREGAEAARSLVKRRSNEAS